MIEETVCTAETMCKYAISASGQHIQFCAEAHSSHGATREVSDNKPKRASRVIVKYSQKRDEPTVGGVGLGSHEETD